MNTTLRMVMNSTSFMENVLYSTLHYEHLGARFSVELDTVAVASKNSNTWECQWHPHREFFLASPARQLKNSMSADIF